MAIAREPYQELFQGFLTCPHSDRCFGGLKSGQTTQVRGTMYFVDADVDESLARYAKGFPEHVQE